MDFGNLFAAIGRALPGFVEGERLAVQDNWNDLNQYNKVQAGQLENAFTEQTFNPRMQIVYDAARNSGLGVLNNRMTTAQNWMLHPALMARNYYASLYAPQNAQLEQQMLDIHQMQLELDTAQERCEQALAATLNNKDKR